MFTLTISICCFWNNQQRGPGEKHRELLQVALNLGFMIGRLGLIMLDSAEGGWGVTCFLCFKALSRFLVAAWKKARALGMSASLLFERRHIGVRSVTIDQQPRSP